MMRLIMPRSVKARIHLLHFCLSHASYLLCTIFFTTTRIISCYNRPREACHLAQEHAFPEIRLQVHHIFPKALLYQHGYSKADVNAITNLTFLTQDTNLRVSDRAPAEYLEAFARTQPGAVASHWIPMDRDLWQVENYHAFLAARRERLAQAANAFLDSLSAGAV